MQPESVDQPEVTNPEGSAHADAPVKDAVVQPAPSQPGKKKSSPAKFLIGFLIFILLIGVAGLGYWGYTLNNDLTAAQSRLAELQGKHDELQADNEKLTSEIAQTKADIEKAQDDTKSARSDLTNAQNKAKIVTERLTTTSKYMAIVDSIFVKEDNDIVITIEVALINDTELTGLFETIIKKGATTENFNAFINYVFETIAANLKK